MDIDYRQEGSPVKGILVGVFASLVFVACWCIAATLCGSGCIAPDGAVDRVAVTNTIHVVKDIVVKARNKAGEKKEASSDTAADPPAADPTADGGQSAGAAASGPLVFKFGGFHGENAVEDPNTQIKDLHMSRSGMSYKWAKGNLSNWGLSHDDAHALACAFYWDAAAGQWIGGKFDWISTSRTTRDFKNLEDYNGWRSGPFFAASKRAFCIVSEDGKRRTNILETKEP